MQSYENHTAKFPLQHFIWLPLSALSLLALIVYFFTENNVLQMVLMATTLIIAIIGGMLARLYGLKLQDRIIRLEEHYRHSQLTNTPFPATLTLAQIIALRFAPDDEFPALAKRAAEENLSADAIKKSIKQWRADTQRI